MGQGFNWWSLALPTGRLNRIAYLLFFVGIYVLNNLIGVVVYAAMKATFIDMQHDAWGFPLIMAMQSLLSLYLWTCAGIKRLHDFGGRAVWFTLPFVPPAIALALLSGTLIQRPADAYSGEAAFAAMVTFGMVASTSFIVSTLILLLVPGQKDANRFGSPLNWLQIELK